MTKQEERNTLKKIADLEREHPKALNAEIKQMFTERYGAYNGVSGLTFVV